jgi:hypothetical protein
MPAVLTEYLLTIKTQVLCPVYLRFKHWWATEKLVTKSIFSSPLKSPASIVSHVPYFAASVLYDVKLKFPLFFR